MKIRIFNSTSTVIFMGTSLMLMILSGVVLVSTNDIWYLPVMLAWGLVSVVASVLMQFKLY